MLFKRVKCTCRCNDSTYTAVKNKKKVPRNILRYFFSLQILASETTNKFIQYQLGTGDKIKVVIYGQNDLSGEFKLDGSGRISLPLLNEIQAAGLTVAELESKIVTRLSPDYLIDPKVNIEVIKYRPFFIIGEVKNPGQYPYVSGMTVLTAVALAGGYTYRAKANKALITHVKHLAKNQRDANRDTDILPGDIIEIPRKRWLF